ncbi:MAG: sigma-70 family RNA polymerase sigma factor [Phycisphaeraceae bacterium]|nr:sigma-70 family RNA polymerase sigma factor [Phycisphaeraceae bacterium]
MDRTPERMPDQIYDEWLVIRSQDGEPGAIAELVARWNGRLLGFALGITRREDSARDAVQAAWMAAARDIGRLRDPARFPAWILRLVSNKCADAARRDRRARRAERGRARDLGERIVNRTASASDLDERSEVREAIATLGPAQREILGLHYGAGLGIAEIASCLGVPAGTVKSRLHAARAELRAILERRAR